MNEWNQIQIELEELKAEKERFFEYQQKMYKWQAKLATKSAELEERQRQWFYENKKVKECAPKEEKSKGPRRKKVRTVQEDSRFKGMSKEEQDRILEILG